MPSVTLPHSDFETAARAALKLLRDRLGFDLWMVTRTDGDDWTVLHTEDHGYGVKEGTVLRWSDSFCSRMVRGEGPRIAPRADDVPAYVAAPIGRAVSIGAYAGTPLTRPDGSLFGTLCAIDPDAQSNCIRDEQPLIDLIALMLNGILKADLLLADQTRRAERAEAEALTDALTGLYNRRGWDQLLQSEELRCERDASPACVLSIDLDNLKTLNDTEGHARGDALLRAAADTLLAAVRDQDIVARIGGDEFFILGVECNVPVARSLLQRINAALVEADISASVGLAQRTAEGGLASACTRADAAMYVKKCDRKGRLKLSLAT